MLQSFLIEKQTGLIETEEEIFGAEIDMIRGKVHAINTFSSPKETFSLPPPLHNTLITTPLATQESLIRPLNLSLQKIKDVDAVLLFEAEPLLPFPAEEALMDRIILSQSKEKTSLSVVACRSDILLHHINSWQDRNVEPEHISTTPAALASYASLFPLLPETHFVLYLGNKEGCCALIHEKKLIAAFPIRGTKQKNSSLQQTLTQILYALGKQYDHLTPTEILLCGEEATDISWMDAWSHTLTYTLRHPSSLEGIPLSDRDLMVYALPIGLALNALPSDPNHINFRKKGFSYPRPWRKCKKTLLITLPLSLVLALSFWLFSFSYTHYQKGVIQKEYAELLEAMRYSHHRFEEEFSSPAGGISLEKGKNLVPLEKFSLNELENRLHYIEKKLTENPFEFPLSPNTPRVSDTLAWLLNHPVFVSTDMETGERAPLLQLENFLYSLVKHPDLLNKKERYQVKIDIDFSTDLPKQARAFHDALIEPNPFVDPKEEIKWNAQKGKYHVSFFLKDKTSYTTGKK